MERPPHSHRDSLHAYHPARGEPPTDACAEALEASLADAELRAWWEAEQAFDAAMRDKLRAIPVPGDLRGRILAAAASEQAMAAKVEAMPSERSNWWHWGALASTAAAVMFLALFYTFFATPTVLQAQPNDQLQSIMAQLEAQLDSGEVERHRSEDYASLVRHLDVAGAPVPKFIPAGFDQQSGFACAYLEVDGVPVGMMCFRVDDGVYHVFTIDRRHLPDQQDLPREVVQTVNDHCRATWTRDDQIYILVTKEPAEKVLAML